MHFVSISTFDFFFGEELWEVQHGMWIFPYFVLVKKKGRQIKTACVILYSEMLPC